MKYIFLLILFTACTLVKPLKKQAHTNVDTKVYEEPAIKRLVVTEVKDKEVATSPKITKFPVFTKENTNKVKTHCDNINLYFKKYDWGKSKCHEFTWHHVRNSYLGNPITWFVFGDDDAKDVNTTMILCGVHGDEITPVKFCFDVLDDLRKNPSVLKDRRVVLAPLVTPD